jgi:DNA-binding NarL/FixJ family response regulator
LTKGSRARVGVVAADPLRSIGLLAILEETVGVDAVRLGMSEDREVQGLNEMQALSAGKESGAFDALLLDTRLPLDELSELIARIRRDHGGLKVVVMGAQIDPHYVQSVIGAGAKGYLAETASEGEIRMAMDVVLDGSIWAPRKVLARLIDAGGVSFGGLASGSDSVVGVMTPRELEVLHLLMDGRTNRDIASAMGIDEVTVKAHLGRMLRKTRSSNRVELTLRAIEERTTRVQPNRPSFQS